jgi:hypothetical protein
MGRHGWGFQQGVQLRSSLNMATSDRCSAFRLHGAPCQASDRGSIIRYLLLPRRGAAVQVVDKVEVLLRMQGPLVANPLREVDGPRSGTAMVGMILAGRGICASALGSISRECS